jgi:hypothetical protein
MVACGGAQRSTDIHDTLMLDDTAGADRPSCTLAAHHQLHAAALCRHGQLGHDPEQVQQVT